MEQQPNLFDLQIDPQSETFLRETARWGKFLSIVGFVFCGIMVIIAIFAGSIFGAMSGQLGPMAMLGAAPSMVITVVYLLLTLLWFLPCLYLFNFSTKMKTALAMQDQSTLHVSLKNLKSCFRFLGIMILVIFGFYILVFVLAMLFTAFS